MSFAQDLRTEVSYVLQNAVLDLRIRDTLIKNLVFLYHTIRASEQLLEFGAEFATGDLKVYYAAHLEEEKGHANWLLQDLIAAGVPEQVYHVDATQFAGAMYYHLIHTHHSTLLGYMVVMEGFPAPIEVIEALEKIHGEAIMRTSRYHAEHDGDHFEDLAKVIDARTPTEQSVIRMVALDVARHMVQILQRIRG